MHIRINGKKHIGLSTSIWKRRFAEDRLIEDGEKKEKKKKRKVNDFATSIREFSTPT